MYSQHYNNASQSDIKALKVSRFAVVANKVHHIKVIRHLGLWLTSVSFIIH